MSQVALSMTFVTSCLIGSQSITERHYIDYDRTPPVEGRRNSSLAQRTPSDTRQLQTPYLTDRETDRQRDRQRVRQTYDLSERMSSLVKPTMSVWLSVYFSVFLSVFLAICLF